MEDVRVLQADRAWRILGRLPKPSVLEEVLFLVGFAIAAGLSSIVLGIVLALVAGYAAA